MGRRPNSHSPIFLPLPQSSTTFQLPKRVPHSSILCLSGVSSGSPTLWAPHPCRPFFATGWDLTLPTRCFRRSCSFYPLSTNHHPLLPFLGYARSSRHRKSRLFPHQRRSRQPALLQRMGAGSRPPHVAKQPRRRSRRAPPGPRRLRRHRPGRPQLGLLPRHRPLASGAGKRRDAARPVRQARRRLPHPRLRPPRPHLQLQPRRTLVQLGAVQRPRARRPDDVRPDDRRLVDLHRLAGHHPGNLRNLFRCRRPTPRRRPRRQAHRLRRHGRHGPEPSPSPPP